MPVGSTVPPLGYRPAKVAVATAEATAPALILTASRKPAGAGNRAVFAFDGPCCPGKGLVIRIYTDSEINGNECWNSYRLQEGNPLRDGLVNNPSITRRN